MNTIKGTRLVPCEIQVTDEQLLEAFSDGSIPSEVLIDKLGLNLRKQGELRKEAFLEHGNWHYHQDMDGTGRWIEKKFLRKATMGEIAIYDAINVLRHEYGMKK
ncbi:hypothetical protein VPHD479_0381 [Vibrio phage D479]